MWPYLGSKALNKKLRTHSFLQLLKFEKAKCPYFSYWWPRSRYIVHFSLWRQLKPYTPGLKRRNPHMNKKLRTVSFLQLLKFEKATRSIFTEFSNFQIFKSHSFVCKQEFRIGKEHLCRCFGSYKLREETKTLQSITQSLTIIRYLL